MDNLIFISKYDRLEPRIASCLPEGSTLTQLDSFTVLAALPQGHKRKALLAACRESLDEAERKLLQPVISYKEHNDRIEIALPGMIRFFPKHGRA